MTIVLKILLIILALAQTMAIAKGDKAYAAANLTDAGIRIGSLIALPITIYAFYSESWILWLISFFTQLTVQDTVSDIQLTGFNGGKFITQIIILSALVAWYIL